MTNKIKSITNKKNRSKIVCLTAYSKNIAEIIDNHVDIVLVGDSLGSVLYNYKTTRKVSLKMMIEHTKSVRMGTKKSLLVIDLPYNTYRNKSEALRNAKMAIKETKCNAVKMDSMGIDNTLKTWTNMWNEHNSSVEDIGRIIENTISME